MTEIKIGAVWLRTTGGDRAQVLVLLDKDWRVVIDDLVRIADGKLMHEREGEPVLCPVSHIVETAGIARSPIDPVTSPGAQPVAQFSPGIADGLVEALWECCESVGATEGRIRALVEGHLAEYGRLERVGKSLDHALSSLLAVRTGLTDQMLADLQVQLRVALQVTR